MKKQFIALATALCVVVPASAAAGPQARPRQKPKVLASYTLESVVAPEAAEIIEFTPATFPGTLCFQATTGLSGAIAVSCVEIDTSTLTPPTHRQPLPDSSYSFPHEHPGRLIHQTEFTAQSAPEIGCLLTRYTPGDSLALWCKRRNGAQPTP